MTVTKAEIAAARGLTEDGLDVIDIAADVAALEGFIAAAARIAEQLSTASATASTALQAELATVKAARDGVATSTSATPGADARAVAAASRTQALGVMSVYKRAVRDARNALAAFSE